MLDQSEEEGSRTIGMNLLYTIFVIVRVMMLTNAEILRMFCRHGGSLLCR